MKPDNKIVIAAVLLLCAGFLVIFMPAGRIAPIDAITDENIKIFGSQEELEDFIKYSAENSGGYGGWDTRGGMLGEVAMDMAVAEAAPAAGAAKSSDGASDFSTTNIQVEGVDEADIVKSDGKYLYVLAGKKLAIIDAYPAETAEKLSEISFDNNPSEIFINGNKLVVFTQDYHYGRYYGSGGKTRVYLYDVSDRSRPKLEKNISTDGNYFDSRMIGDYVYVIVNEPIYYRPCYPYYGGWDIDLDCLKQEIRVPELIVDGEAVDKGFPSVYYWDFPDSSYRFTTVMAFNVNGGKPNKKVFVMGSSQNIFVSQSNIYLTRTRWMSYQEMQERIYDEVIIPSMPPEVKDELDEIESSDKSAYRKRLERLIVVKEYLANLDSGELRELETSMSEKMRLIEEEFYRTREQTAVSRIAISAGQISPKETGSVPGTVLNQFSMDEYGGYFRIATTTSRWSGEQSNNLYVLDMDMELVGKVEGIAPGESIFSARFMGEKAYMVTFRQVDPLFVIDLSDPTAPKILGQLKIPGYSDYLHPYGENHLIGIGKEVDETITDFAAIQGVKLAIFDVSDVENPIELYKEVIGDRGSESEATREHKAFLFDKEKGLLVVPILLAEVSEKQKDQKGWQTMQGQFTFQGAYVYSISLDKGFELRGRVTHLDDAQELLKSGYYFSSPYSVKRSLYMDDVLYTVSSKKVKMSDLNDLSYVNEVELPYEDEGRYPYWDGPEIVF
jgi:inhibitor of cysteine peptidase